MKKVWMIPNLFFSILTASLSGVPWNVEYASTEEGGEYVVGDQPAPARLYQPLPVHMGQTDCLEN